jgi:hypothetical protein
MRKIGVLVLAAATAMVLAVGSGSAVAASDAQRTCEAGGGVYTKTGSTAFCDFGTENVGNAPEHSNAQETSSTETGQGNLKKSEPVCEGPPGQCAQR